MADFFGPIIDAVILKRSTGWTNYIVQISVVVIEAAVEAFAVLIIVLNQGKQQPLT